MRLPRSSLLWLLFFSVVLYAANLIFPRSQDGGYAEAFENLRTRAAVERIRDNAMIRRHRLQAENLQRALDSARLRTSGSAVRIRELVQAPPVALPSEALPWVRDLQVEVQHLERELAGERASTDLRIQEAERAYNELADSLARTHRRLNEAIELGARAARDADGRWSLGCTIGGGGTVGWGVTAGNSVAGGVTMATGATVACGLTRRIRLPRLFGLARAR